jgi:hypothetical protein
MLKKALFASLALSTVSAFSQVPNEALTFDTNVKIVNGTSSQTTKIRAAEDLIKRVVATQAFKDAVLNYTYGGKKTYVDNDGYSNAQIYQKILDASEALNKGNNNIMDLEVEIYTNNFTSTVGYTYEASKRIYVNTKFFNYYTPAEVAGNMFHEWLHKIGFDHAASYSVARDSSVPYAVGYILERLAKKIDDIEAPTTPTIPTTPAVLSAATSLALSQASTKLTLKWEPAVSSAGIQEYKIFRVLTGATTAYLQGTTTSLSYTQDLPTTSAAYYVKAVAKDGKTINSAKVNYTKVPVLEAGTNLALSKTSTKVNLKWSAANASEGISTYKVYRILNGASTAYLQGSTTSLSFSQTKPTANAVYYVKAVDKSGATINSSRVSFTK